MKVSGSFTSCIYFIIVWTFRLPEAYSFSSSSNKNIHGKNPKENKHGNAEESEFKLGAGAYEIQHDLKNGVFGCNEVFTVKMKRDPFSKTFKAKCLKEGKRKVYEVNTVVLIGDPDDTFCLFGRDGVNYYYKDKKNIWWKVEGASKEIQITEAEHIADLTKDIIKWKKMIEKHFPTLAELYGQRVKLKQSLKEELYNINTMKMEEAGKLKERLVEIRNRANEENLKNDPNIHADGSQDVLTKTADLIKQREHDVSTQQAEAEQQLKAKEHELDERKNQALAKHDHAQKELLDRYNQEMQVFQQEFQKLMQS